jgi:hypothetical protein
MIPFPEYKEIQSRYNCGNIELRVYEAARDIYEIKRVSETALLAQFRARNGLTGNQAAKLFCDFLIREALFLAQDSAG